ncbi:MAG: DUF2059 domain-containing protein [Verrucomicrobia bacterium]|nr:DUF2059 domain-containing protein [Verrucomicrobiota bacterium]MCH8510751.1 DUF2059 domain-containing protein [Kiritimatiellia bacterium]
MKTIKTRVIPFLLLAVFFVAHLLAQSPDVLQRVRRLRADAAYEEMKGNPSRALELYKESHRLLPSDETGAKIRALEPAAMERDPLAGPDLPPPPDELPRGDAEISPAGRLVDLMGMREWVEEAKPGFVLELLNAMPGMTDHVDLLIVHVEETLDWQKIRPEITALLEASFTPDELTDMLAFYQSPVGRKMMAALPELSADMQLRMEGLFLNDLDILELRVKQRELELLERELTFLEEEPTLTEEQP